MTDQRDLFAREKHPLPESVTADLMQAVEYFRAHDLPFTAEMLRDRCSDASRAILMKQEHVNGLGGFVQGLSRGRTPKIKPDGFVEAQRDAARGRPIRRWRHAA